MLLLDLLSNNQECLLVLGSDDLQTNLWYTSTSIVLEGSQFIICEITRGLDINMLVAEQFIQSLIRRYGRHNISTDGDI
jgi:hypothetical protein